MPAGRGILVTVGFCVMSSTALPALASGRRLLNLWDAGAMLCVFGALVAVAGAARSTLAPLPEASAAVIHLAPSYLPEYALRTTMRMFAALVASLAFTFTVAPLAARSRRAALLVIPALDILQSVPILGFLTFTVTFFLNLFPGRVLGAEFAAIFVIFTSQAWNMAFSFYQSLVTEPEDLIEAARLFRLTPWQRFWRLDVPFAVPGLVWNTMLSMSGGWFFVVASEAVSVGNRTFTLPGIGSYVALALTHERLGAIAWAILAMLAVILAYDQILFRPLVAWSAKFRFETIATLAPPDPWVLKLVRRTRFLRLAGQRLGGLADRLAGLPLAVPGRRRRAAGPPSRLVDALFYVVLAVALAAALWRIASFLAASLAWSDALQALLYGLFTLARVIAVLAISCIVWVPIGVWLGLRPAYARIAQPVAQFLAAFPANLLFPPMVLVIVYFRLDPAVWLTPLMLLGTQWYVLFNVVAGAAAFPGDLREAAANFRVGGLLWWRRVILPGILPYLVTGAITATGNAWNTSIVAELAAWGKVTLVAPGLGAYIAQATADGATSKVVLGVAVMSAFVLLFNRLVWRPLYDYARRRTSF